jgi:Na+-transporting NADH:ubiquinone oxidoreductase subunit NqrD
MFLLKIIAGIHLVAAIIMILLAIPLYREKVAPNAIYGVRITKSFESPENWYKINGYGGKQLLMWGSAFAVVCLVLLAVPLPTPSARPVLWYTLLIFETMLPLVVVFGAVICTLRYSKSL